MFPPEEEGNVTKRVKTLLVGLWTPIAGVVIAGRELWIVLSGGGDFWLPLVLAILGATLAMIGPGAWSVDDVAVQW